MIKTDIKHISKYGGWYVILGLTIILGYGTYLVGFQENMAAYFTIIGIFLLIEACGIIIGRMNQTQE